MSSRPISRATSYGVMPSPSCHPACQTQKTPEQMDDDAHLLGPACTLLQEPRRYIDVSSVCREMQGGRALQRGDCERERTA